MEHRQKRLKSRTSRPLAEKRVINGHFPASFSQRRIALGSRRAPITVQKCTSWQVALLCAFSPMHTALEHFAHVDDGATDRIVRARATYWRGRAAEALGKLEEMNAQYSAAAR